MTKNITISTFLMQLQNPELAYEAKKISLYTRTWQSVLLYQPTETLD